MGFDEKIFRRAWVEQANKPNCGSCCVGSIVNYSNRKNKAGLVAMDEDAYVGLLVGGVHNLGSVTSRLAQWARATYPGLFKNVTEVKVKGKSQHWGGAINSKLLTGGTAHRPTITADANYFSLHTARFLLRECSAYAVAGHFIIQTDADEFWDPNRKEWELPLDLASIKAYYPWVKGVSALSMRADGCQFDVA